MVTVAAISSAFVAVLLVAAGTTTASPIQQVVVLMLENRAFDHMCGRLPQWGVNVNGLSGKEFNVANGTKYFVNDTCPYINPFDPSHSYQGTLFEVMGDAKQWHNPEPMSGFAEYHMRRGDMPFWNVLDGFPPHRVPAISTIAKEFAVFDHYFSGLPGPTMPNRIFFLSGQSDALVSGFSDNKEKFILGIPVRTVFDVLESNGLDWRVYFEDFPDVLMFKGMRSWDSLRRFHVLDQFKKDAASGNLVNFTWLNPRWYPTKEHPARDQHPDHDVVDGEDLIAEVYQAIRNSPQWNSTALIVTYDEHGGFYDHVPPPFDIPSPTGVDAPNGFNFTRGGVRVCQVVISPLVPKGTIVSKPTNGPFPNSEFEHSSLYATLRNMFNLKEELTNRTAWAAPYDFLFSLTEPRTDCPTTLPTPARSPDNKRRSLHQQRVAVPNDLQRELFPILAATAEQLGVHGAHKLMQEQHLSQEEQGTHAAKLMSGIMEQLRSSEAALRGPE